MEHKRNEGYVIVSTWTPLITGVNSGAPNRIGGIMLSVLTSGVVDRGFEPRSGKTKDYKIGICYFSAKHASLRKKQRLVGLESG